LCVFLVSAPGAAFEQRKFSMQFSSRESPNSRYGSLRRKFQSLLPASTLLLVAACGGGGGGGDPPSSPATPPPPTNAAPVANAGTDQTVELPLRATLQGSATDSDTAAGSLTYAWSGPAGVTFSAPTAATTDATFASAGAQTLTLTVSDGSSTVTDTIVVTVNPALFPEADNTPDDPHGWTRVAPADVGMTQAGLDEAAAYAQSAPLPAGPGNGMIVRHGRLVFSWGDIDDRAQKEVKSVTKSMGGIALGLAMDEGKLALADKADQKMASFGVPPDSNAATGFLSQITIGQLATHTAGFEKPGGYSALRAAGPGKEWFYSDAGLNWLADTLTEVYGQDLSELLTSRVWSVLGVTTDDVIWRSMATGLRPLPRAQNPTLQYRELASGITANVNAMARVGLLFLRRGMWKDQRILQESFIDLVQTPRPENETLALPLAADFPNATKDYGVLWWTNKSGQMANVPRDAYWAWGLGEALIVVIPSLDLVIARNGGQLTVGDQSVRTWNDNDWNGDVKVLEPFLNPIVAATTP
jgi:CubicO group peptidase (beta-lactamase class C family)